jgi:predicted  nucleic acid-binding Zn-ribbon protein
MMHNDVEVLLALQADDSEIFELERRLRALEPRMSELDKKKEGAVAALNRARGAVETEERRQRDLHTKVAAHKQMQERNLATLDAVKRLKEATAAMAQVESARRIIAEDESELQTISRRLNELRAAVDNHEASVMEIEAEQETARKEIDEERVEITASLDTARQARTEKTSGVPRPLLGKYDRIRTRRPKALYALRGDSCGNCDTAIPMQRRNLMAVSGAIDVCEACGVLLYRGASA